VISQDLPICASPYYGVPAVSPAFAWVYAFPSVFPSFFTFFSSAPFFPPVACVIPLGSHPQMFLSPLPVHSQPVPPCLGLLPRLFFFYLMLPPPTALDFPSLRFSEPFRSLLPTFKTTESCSNAYHPLCVISSCWLLVQPLFLITCPPPTTCCCQSPPFFLSHIADQRL